MTDWGVQMLTRMAILTQTRIGLQPMAQMPSRLTRPSGKTRILIVMVMKRQASSRMPVLMKPATRTRIALAVLIAMRTVGRMSTILSHRTQISGVIGTRMVMATNRLLLMVTSVLSLGVIRPRTGLVVLMLMEMVGRMKGMHSLTIRVSGRMATWTNLPIRTAQR